MSTLRTLSAETAPVISIHGAREHNLKNLSVVLPRNQFVVITGVSGSGKSTLAFDLLFAEGQRRFLDSMNAYARQFVEQMARPDVDLITGLPPTVSIEQRTTRGGGKSTVATVTEIYHFLRLLFARLGVTYCPDCQVPVEAQTKDQLAKRLHTEAKRRGELLLLAPVVRNRKGFHTDVAAWATQNGYAQIRADGKIHPTEQALRLDRFREHDVEIVVGTLGRKSQDPPSGGGPIASPRQGQRGLQARKPNTPRWRSPQQLIDEALALGHGTLFALDDEAALTVHSIERACPTCGRSYAPLDPKNFSYNSAQGWCPRCRGFGELFYLPDVDRGARADAIEEFRQGLCVPAGANIRLLKIREPPAANVVIKFRGPNERTVDARADGRVESGNHEPVDGFRRIGRGHAQHAHAFARIREDVPQRGRFPV